MENLTATDAFAITIKAKENSQSKRQASEDSDIERAKCIFSERMGIWNQCIKVEAENGSDRVCINITEKLEVVQPVLSSSVIFKVAKLAVAHFKELGFSSRVITEEPIPGGGDFCDCNSSSEQCFVSVKW